MQNLPQTNGYSRVDTCSERDFGMPHHAPRLVNLISLERACYSSQKSHTRMRHHHLSQSLASSWSWVGCHEDPSPRFEQDHDVGTELQVLSSLGYRMRQMHAGDTNAIGFR
jgi:hypothetical protein